MTGERVKDCAALLAEAGGTEVRIGTCIQDWYGLNERLGRQATEAELDQVTEHFVEGSPPGWVGVISWKNYPDFLQEWRRDFRR